MEMISAFASSSNSSVMSFKKYDVFLSFRGEDTRTTFTSHLYEALREKVVTFIDYELKKGDEISPALIEAIENSHVSVVILSENYASSKWCLEELRKILECKKNQGQEVKPVFYNTDPSNVRNQTGSYGQAFAKHKGDDRCNKWKAALTEVANLAGWDSRGRTESELIKDIVRNVLAVLQNQTPTYPNQLERLVGIEYNYKQIEPLLKIGSGEVRTIGIWGMGGIGKTTLAIALYAKLSHKFEVCCFLANVRENSSSPGGLKALHKKLFSELLGKEVDAPLLLPYFVIRELGRKKALIVLDDVDTVEQLDSLTKACGLGPGSRIVVTTRNKQIFHKDVEVYQVKELSLHHSIHLFSLTAFGQEQPEDGYEDLSRKAISYCKGSPLALKVLGASLRQRSKEVWNSQFEKFQQTKNVKIHNILKSSYDDLEPSEKDIFLDIACFLKGEKRDFVINLLEASNFFAASGIEVLLDKALITISNYNMLEMHDLIQQMGQEIVLQKSINDPGKRSRIWKPKEALEVLKYNRGTDVVEAIILDLETLTENLSLSSDSLAKMTNVRFLKISSGKWHMWWSNKGFNVYFPNGLESLSYKLRYLHWEDFCLKSLPSNFCAEQLVELRMPNSKLIKLWDGIQNLVNLKTINLLDSRDLIEIPDLSKAEKLEIVRLCGCKSLRELHPSVSSLPNLTKLSLTGCRGIESLNVHAKSLKKLWAIHCSSLREFLMGSITAPDHYGCMQHNASELSLEELWLIDTNVESLPANIKNLSSLRFLSLKCCMKLVSLPELPPSLTELDLNGCIKLVSLPELPPSLTQLYLYGCSKLVSLPELPPSITELQLCGCSKLVSLPELPPSLTKLNLDGCSKLVSLPELPPSLTKLNLDGCSKLVSLPELPPSLTKLHSYGCSKLVSLPELPPLLKKEKAQNCTSLDTDLTQQLVLQHILQRLISHYHDNLHAYYKIGHFIFPGDHVTDECGFREAGSSITIPYLPLPPSSHLHGFIYCVILPNGFCSDINRSVMCSVYQDGEEVDRDTTSKISGKLISEHVLFSYVEMFNDCSDNLSFQLEFYCDDRIGCKHHQECIKECGVFPVYVSESGLKLFGNTSSSKGIFELESIAQISENKSHPREIVTGGSSNDNEEDSEQLLPLSKRRRT